MLESIILGQVLNYYLWLLALTLAFSSSIIFFKLYAKSRGTPLGRVAFYISINSFLWSIAIAVLSVPSMTMVGIYTDIFLVATSLAGVASIVAAYYRAVIQWLLTPSSDGKSRDHSCLLRIMRFDICSCLLQCHSLCVEHSFLERSNEGTIDLGRHRDHLPYWIPHHASPIKTSS